MKIELWPVDKPQPYARNARKISELAIEKVARSIKEFGWRQPIVVDAEGVVIAGHTRLLAAKSMGEKKVPVCVAADLTPEQVKAYRLADNRSHEEAEWDLEMLGAELFDLKGLGLDLGSTAFDEDELSQLLSPKGLKGTKTKFRRRQRRRSRGPGTSGCWETTGCSAAIARRAPTSQR